MRHRPRDISSVPGAASADSVDVVLNVEEKGAHTISTGTYMNGGEGTAELSWTLRNLFGNAERLQGNASLGHKTSNTCVASPPTPHPSTLPGC